MCNKLLTHFDNWIRHETNPDEPLHKSIVAAHEKIMNYYNLTNESTICTVLHPRFGINYYKRDADGTTDSYEKSYAVVNSLYKKFYAPINQQGSSVVADKYDLFGNEPVVDELEDYCTNIRDSLTQNQDILIWWKVNSKRFPNLSLMATSAFSERLFSSENLMISDFRNCLSASTFQAEMGFI